MESSTGDKYQVQNADKLDIGNLLMLGATYKTGIIRHKEIKANENGEEI